MTNYELNIQRIESAKSELNYQLRLVKNAAQISYNSWDADTRNAYQRVIASIENEISSISIELNNLKKYIGK